MEKSGLLLFHSFSKRLLFFFLIQFIQLNVANGNDKADSSYHFRNKAGYFTSIDFGYYMGVGTLLNYYGPNYYHSLGIENVNGYRFNKNVQIGLGVGYEIYNTDSNLLPPKEYIPLFIDIKMLAPIGNNCEFGFLFDAGHHFSLGFSSREYYIGMSPGGYEINSDEFKGGSFFRTAICFRKWNGEIKNSWWVCLGFEKQNNKFYSTTIGQAFGTPYFQNARTTHYMGSEFLYLKVGFEF